MDYYCAMDITRQTHNSSSFFTATGSYEEMCDVVESFHLLDPRSRPFHKASKLAISHRCDEVSVTDLSARKLEKIALKLEDRKGENHPIAQAIHSALDESHTHIYQPEY